MKIYFSVFVINMHKVIDSFKNIIIFKRFFFDIKYSIEEVDIIIKL